MRHFLFLLLTMIMFAPNKVHAQTMYRLNFSNGPGKELTDAFFVMYDNGVGFARLNNPGTRRSEIQLLERFGTDDAGNTDTTILVYDPAGARYVADSSAAPAYRFWFRKEASTGLFRPYAVTEDTNTQLPAVSNTGSDSLIDPNLISPAFIKNYFSIKEGFYLSRFGAGTRGGLSETDLKTRIYLIIVASSYDETIGPSTLVDAQKAISTFSDVADALHIRKNLVVDTVYGDNYNKANVLAAVNRIKPTGQDIVVFYYSGHGFTDTEKPNLRYPFMDLRDPRIRPRTDAKASAVNIETIYETIKKKGARFNLVISDCCNDVIESTNRILPPPPRPGRPRGDTLMNMDNLKNLFLNQQKASLLVTAASKYERATSNNRYGGFFTNNFIQTLRSGFYPQADKPSWPGIMAVAQKLTIFQANNTTCPEPGKPDNKCHQTPFPKIN